MIGAHEVSWAYLNEREGRAEENKCWSITLSEWV